MDLLKKLCIKDYKKVDDPKVRAKYGIVAGISGIIINILLFISKLVVGILSGSITIVADAVNNFSDLSSSTVSIVGFKLSSKPADSEHPYGHERIEQISALIVALFVFAVGAILAKTSIDKIIKPEELTISLYTYIILGIGILLKIVQMVINYNFGKCISSQTLKAVGDDSRNDIITTTVVLISTIVIKFTGVNIDGYAGLLVSLFIIISSIILIKETINPLIGIKPKQELVKKLKTTLLSYENIIGVHDVMIHSYGEKTAFAVAHLEVPAEKDFVEMHNLIDKIENEIHDNLGIYITIHMDPVDTTNPKIQELKERCAKVIIAFGEGFSLHDFRVVFGNDYVNIIFDIVIPFKSKTTLSAVKKALKEEFKNEEIKHRFVLEEDRDYV